MPEVPGLTVGLTPTSGARKEGLGAGGRASGHGQVQTKFPTGGSLNQAAP